MSLDPWGLTFAFTTGAFVLFSPCGFPMLPGYISYYIAVETPIRRATIGGIAAATGLIVVFTVIGVTASVLGSFISRYVPFLQLIAGLITITMGLSMITNRFPAFCISIRAPKRRSLLGIFLYGVVYGLATLGCSAPIFFSVLFYAIVSSGPLYGMLIFAVYAIGMGLPLIVITILVAKARNSILEKAVKITPLLHKLSSIPLVLIGTYLVYYYTYSISV